MGDDEVGRLPHWARVAFAARCGRVGLTLFRAAWPTAAPECLAALRAAVEQAEQSAATATAAAGGPAAALAACQVAGAALKTSAAASLAAKPAEFAAQAAAAGPDDSAGPATRAYEFALEAAWEAGIGELADRLDADLARLRWAAAAGAWGDQTPVSPAAFGRM